MIKNIKNNTINWDCKEVDGNSINQSDMVNKEDLLITIYGGPSIGKVDIIFEEKLCTYATSPDLKGFSSQNIWRMKQFYECYRDNEKLSTLLREISWSNNLHILSKTKSIEEKEFYIRLCIEEKYSARELARQIDSAYFERSMLSKGKISTNITEKYPQISNMFKDSYILEFLNLPEKFYEKDLQKAIIHNLKKFILEFGKDFIFVGEEYKLQVGNNDYYIDLLFYNRNLSTALVAEYI